MRVCVLLLYKRMMAINSHVPKHCRTHLMSLWLILWLLINSQYPFEANVAHPVMVAAMLCCWKTTAMNHEEQVIIMDNQTWLKKILMYFNVVPDFLIINAH